MGRQKKGWAYLGRKSKIKNTLLHWYWPTKSRHIAYMLEHNVKNGSQSRRSEYMDSTMLPSLLGLRKYLEKGMKPHSPQQYVVDEEGMQGPEGDLVVVAYQVPKFL